MTFPPRVVVICGRKTKMAIRTMLNATNRRIKNVGITLPGCGCMTPWLEHLREDGKRGRGECDEDLGNDVCNYCATRKARKFALDVEVVRTRSLQVSTLDAVREIWRRGGDSNPR